MGHTQGHLMKDQMTKKPKNVAKPGDPILKKANTRSSLNL